MNTGSVTAESAEPFTEFAEKTNGYRWKADQYSCYPALSSLRTLRFSVNSAFKHPCSTSFMLSLQSEPHYDSSKIPKTATLSS